MNRESKASIMLTKKWGWIELFLILVLAGHAMSFKCYYCWDKEYCEQTAEDQVERTACQNSSRNCDDEPELFECGSESQSKDAVGSGGQSIPDVKFSRRTVQAQTRNDEKPTCVNVTLAGKLVKQACYPDSHFNGKCVEMSEDDTSIWCFCSNSLCNTNKPKPDSEDSHEASHKKSKTTKDTSRKDEVDHDHVSVINDDEKSSSASTTGSFSCLLFITCLLHLLELTAWLSK